MGGWRARRPGTLAERLAGTVLNEDPGAPVRMLTRLAQLSGRDWLRLDDSMRSPYRWSPLDNVTGWPSPWDRVCADLAAISDPDPDLARTGRADLLSWLQRDAATAYGRPSADQAAQIAARLATSTLTSEQRREVAFVAGIRPEPAV